MSEIAHYQIDKQRFMRCFGSSRCFNRVLYGGHQRDWEDYGKFFTFAGDTPIFMGAASDCMVNNWCMQAKRGVLQSGLALTPGIEFGKPDRYSMWFHKADDVLATWQHGFMTYKLSQVSPYFPANATCIEVYPLQEDDGFMVHYNIIADSEVVFCAVLGGMTDYIGRFDSFSSTVRNLSLGDCQGVKAELLGSYGSLTDAVHGDNLLIGNSFSADMSLDAAEAALEPNPTMAIPGHAGEKAVIKLVKRLAAGERLCGNVVVLYNSTAERMQYYLQADRRSDIAAAIEGKSRGIQMSTPDERLDAAVVDQSIALDAAYHYPTFFHGAIGYHAPFLGWRGWYGGTLSNWFDRVQAAVRAHLATQIKPDGTEKVWYDGADRPDLDHEGTQYHHLQNSPGKLTAMLYKEDIYDMQEVAVDMILHYLDNSGDWALGAEIFDAVAEILAWEERILDYDHDGLYQNFLNTWISDGHVYNGGGCTQASCYNYAANCSMIKLGRKLGKDVRIFEERAERIRKAVNERLWMADKGVFAEFADVIGNKLLHPSPELSTVYLASESELATVEQMQRSLDYVRQHIRSVMTLNRGGRLSYSSNWLPKKYSTCGIFPAENAALALAAFRCYRSEEALQLLDGLLDAFALSLSPGAISHVLTDNGGYDNGDWDFTDVSSMFLRLVVEGLWGIRRRRLDGWVEIAPQLPTEWNQARLQLAEITVNCQRCGENTELTVTVQLPEEKRLIIPGNMEILQVSDPEFRLRRTWGGNVPLTVVEWSAAGEVKIVYRQAAENTPVQLPELCLEIPERRAAAAVPSQWDNVALDKFFNAEMTGIFTMQYLSPRPEGYSIGARRNGRYAWEWNHCGHNEVRVDDSALRQAEHGSYTLPSGWSFPTPAQGCNTACVSIWDNFPTVMTLPLSGQATELVVFLFGATNAMQTDVINGRIVVDYQQGPSTVCELIGGYNFDDFLVTAVQQQVERFYWNDFNHGLVIRIPLDEQKQLAACHFEAVANEVIIGVLGAALVR